MIIGNFTIITKTANPTRSSSPDSYNDMNPPRDIKNTEYHFKNVIIL